MNLLASKWTLVTWYRGSNMPGTSPDVRGRINPAYNRDKHSFTEEVIFIIFGLHVPYLKGCTTTEICI